MIQLALEVLAFLFLCWAGFMALIVVIGILGAIGDAIRNATTRGSVNVIRHSLPPGSLTRDHDPRRCPLCLGSGHPTPGRENEGKPERELQIEAVHHREYKQIPSQVGDDPTSFGLRALTPSEPERAWEALHKRDAQEREAKAWRQAVLEQERQQACEAFYRREAERRDAVAAREREDAAERARKKHDEEKREQEAREFLAREAERLLKEREECEAAQKAERESEANRTRWIQ